jgi:hypothetical protein
MKSLEKRHTEYLFKKVREIGDFVFRVEERLTSLGLSETDPDLLHLVSMLNDAAYDLKTELHYRLLDGAGYSPLSPRTPRRLTREKKSDKSIV